MRVRTGMATIVALILTVGTVACSDDGGGGGGGGDLPASDAVVEQLKISGMADDMAECLGRAYAAAGFTADEVRDMGAAAPAADSEKYERFAERSRGCISTDITVPTDD